MCIPSGLPERQHRPSPLRPASVSISMVQTYSRRVINARAGRWGQGLTSRVFLPGLKRRPGSPGLRAVLRATSATPQAGLSFHRLCPFRPAGGSPPGHVPPDPSPALSGKPRPFLSHMRPLGMGYSGGDLCHGRVGRGGGCIPEQAATLMSAGEVGLSQTAQPPACRGRGEGPVYP